MPAAARSSGVSRRALALAACITSVLTSPSDGAGRQSLSASRKRKDLGAAGAGDLEGHHASEAAVEEHPRGGVVRMVREPGVEHPRHPGVLREPAGDMGACSSAPSCGREGAQPAQGEPGLEGAEERALEHPRAAERSRCARACRRRAAGRVRVAVDPLRGGVERVVRALRQRALERRRGEGAVHRAAPRRPRERAWARAGRSGTESSGLVMLSARTKLRAERDEPLDGRRVAQLQAHELDAACERRAS